MRNRTARIPPGRRQDVRPQRPGRPRGADGGGRAMSAETAAAPEAASAAPQAYRLTFGVYDQTAPWTDVRAPSWPELRAVLTRHGVGPKEGSCIVPATFAGARRHKADARRIDVAMLDSDAGATLAEIRDAVARRGWAAIVSSTQQRRDVGGGGAR